MLLVLDGLGWEQLGARRALAPTLAEGTGRSITSVAPSTTAAALTSLVTGRHPCDHGVVGYRVAYDDEILNVLQWTLGGVDARVRVPARAFQPLPLFPGAPGPVPVVTRGDYGSTGFSAAHLGRLHLHSWHTPAGLLTGVPRAARTPASASSTPTTRGSTRWPTPAGSARTTTTSCATWTAWWAMSSACCRRGPRWW